MPRSCRTWYERVPEACAVPGFLSSPVLPEKNIPGSPVAAHPETGRGGVAGTRDIVTHGIRVDWHLLWEGIREELPGFESRVTVPARQDNGLKIFFGSKPGGISREKSVMTLNYAPLIPVERAREFPRVFFRPDPRPHPPISRWRYAYVPGRS